MGGALTQDVPSVFGKGHRLIPLLVVQVGEGAVDAVQGGEPRDHPGRRRPQRHQDVALALLLLVPFLRVELGHLLDLLLDLELGEGVGVGGCACEESAQNGV